MVSFSSFVQIISHLSSFIFHAERLQSIARSQKGARIKAPAQNDDNAANIQKIQTKSLKNERKLMIFQYFRTKTEKTWK